MKEASGKKWASLVPGSGRHGTPPPPLPVGESQVIFFFKVVTGEGTQDRETHITLQYLFYEKIYEQEIIMCCKVSYHWGSTSWTTCIC